MVFTRLSKWYHADGQALKAVVWNETMQELKSAGVADFVASTPAEGTHEC